MSWLITRGLGTEWILTTGFGSHFALLGDGSYGEGGSPSVPKKKSVTPRYNLTKKERRVRGPTLADLEKQRIYEQRRRLKEEEEEEARKLRAMGMIVEARNEAEEVIDKQIAEERKEREEKHDKRVSAYYALEYLKRDFKPEGPLATQIIKRKSMERARKAAEENQTAWEKEQARKKQNLLNLTTARIVKQEGVKPKLPKQRKSKRSRPLLTQTKKRELRGK